MFSSLPVEVSSFVWSIATLRPAGEEEPELS